jgi:NAD binding domain of 6-phosphogluconate dehydrogenase
VSAKANQEKVRVGLLGVGLMGSAMPIEADAVRLVDAPVSGSAHPAEEGELTILASDLTPPAPLYSRSSMRWRRGCSGSGKPGWAHA